MYSITIDMRKPCSSSTHSKDCDGFVDTDVHAYSIRKLNNRSYFYRYICSLNTEKELVPISAEAGEWLKKTLRELDLDNNKYAREIYLTLDAK